MLKQLEEFFNLDKEIKNDMWDLCPPRMEDGMSQYVLVKYWNDAYKTLKRIFENLKTVAANFDDTGYFLEYVDNLEMKTMHKFSSCHTNLADFKEFYSDRVTNMDDDFLESVKQECFGYSIIDLPRISLEKVNTINEMLHLLHSYIVNNIEFYRDVDILAQKKNEDEFLITLRGEDNDLGKEIFKNFPTDIETGDVDIVSLSDKKALMMVRDRGHALMIDVEGENEALEISYFIPKITNVSLVNELPGVKQVNPEKDNINVGTTGKFTISDRTELKQLYDFVAHVPTDEDQYLNRKFR